MHHRTWAVYHNFGHCILLSNTLPICDGDFDVFNSDSQCQQYRSCMWNNTATQPTIPIVRGNISLWFTIQTIPIMHVNVTIQRLVPSSVISWRLAYSSYSHSNITHPPYHPSSHNHQNQSLHPSMHSNSRLLVCTLLLVDLDANRWS